MKQLINEIYNRNLFSNWFFIEDNPWKSNSYSNSFNEKSSRTYLGNLSLFKDDLGITSTKDIQVRQFVKHPMLIPNTSEFIFLDAASKFYISDRQFDDVNINSFIFNEELYELFDEEHKWIFFYIYLHIIMQNRYASEFTIKNVIFNLTYLVSSYNSDFKLELFEDKEALKNNILRAAKSFILNTLSNNIIGYPEKFPRPSSYYGHQSSSYYRNAYSQFFGNKVNYTGFYIETASTYSPLYKNNTINFDLEMNSTFKEDVMIYRGKMFNFKIVSKILNTINNFRQPNILDRDTAHKFIPDSLYAALVIRKEKYNDFIISRLKGDTDVDGYLTLMVDERLKTPTTAKKAGINDFRKRFILKLLSLFKGTGQEIVFTNNLINKLYEKII